MKKIMTLAAFALFLSIGAGAQTVYDATKIANKDLNGTARFVGMGGAMGALGGDISTMGVNPAGIGIYRSNEVMTTFGVSMYGTESKFSGNSFKADNNRFNFDNIGVIFSTKVGNQTSLRYVNFGFNYKRTNSFYKNMSVAGLLNTAPNGDYLSQANYMAAQANKTDSDLGSRNVFEDPKAGWLAALGWNGKLMKEVLENGEYFYVPIVPEIPYSSFSSKESGGIDQYDFNISFNFNDRFYLGATIGAYDVDYSKYSFYDEDYGNTEGYNLQSWNNISGSGFDFKLGAIIRPIESSPLRIGLAIHTPTFYNLTLATSARLESDVLIDGQPTPFDVDTYEEIGGDYRFEYSLRTPWKFNTSIGYTIGSSLALGAEYEYEDYSTMYFKDVDGYEMNWENSTAKDMLKSINTFRIGAEYKISPEFALRAGYNYSTAAFKNDAWKDLTDNSILTDTDYSNTKGISNYTMGFGYRGRSFYADMAYKYTTYKEDFYFFDEKYLNKTDATNNNHQILLTLGVRF